MGRHYGGVAAGHRVCWGLQPLRWALKGLFGARREIVVELRWRLGDEIMALPIYEALRKQHPGARITAWCNYPDLLIDHPHVDAINDTAVCPDRYLLLRSGPRAVYRIEHYARCARVPVPANRPRLHYTDWHVSSIDALKQPFVAVSPGASWETKRWPMDRWRETCARIEAMGYAIVELGYDDEPIGVGTSLMNKTTVREAACVLHAAALFLGCDSGLMHLALAAGTPTVALFGPTDPAILVRDEPNLTAIRSTNPCIGCWNTSPDDIQPGTCPLKRASCLDTISVANVLNEVRSRLTVRG